MFVGDDASPEDPRSILSHFDDNFNIQYKRFGSNIGKKSLTHQWERCIENAPESEWLMILGDDDTLSKDCIETFYANLKLVNKLDINVFRFASQIINEFDNPLSVIFKNNQIETSKEFLQNRIMGGLRSSLSENIFRTSTVKKVGFKSFPLGWHSDDLGVFEFSIHGSSKIFYSNTAVVFIRLTDLSISGNKNMDRLKNIASYRFYKYLLLNYLPYFEADFKFLLFKKLEKTILNNRSNGFLFFNISLFYLKQLFVKKYCNFLKRYLKSFSF